MSAVAAGVSTGQLERLVADTVTRFQLAPPVDAAPEAPFEHDSRHVTIDHHNVAFDGTVTLAAHLGIAEALDLDHAISARAADFKAAGSTMTLDQRRAYALGDLAREHTALDLPAKTRTARELVLHLHFTTGQDTAAGDGGPAIDPVGRLEHGQRQVLLDTVKGWCGDSRTRVTIKPVIDLNVEKSVDGYTIPDRIRDHVILRDNTCTFPWCTRPARSCDLDHAKPYDPDGPPGQTSTSNLTPLCRTHHRLKTHTAWQVRMPTEGVLEWTSPHGHHFVRDHTGTRATRD